MKDIIFERNASLDNLYEPKGTGFDCYCGSKRVGTFCVFKDHSYTDHVQEIAITVEQELRGRGYGKAIYVAFIKKARKLGFKKPYFYAVVYKTNEASIALCESLAFERVKYPNRSVKAYRFKSAD